MYKIIAVIYNRGTLIGYKVTNGKVEEELTIDETYVLALSGLIMDIEAGTQKKLITHNGFDLKTLPRIDKAFGKAPTYYKIAAYIAKSANKASNMLFKPDLIVKQAISSIEKEQERDLDNIKNLSEDLLVKGIAFDLNYGYIQHRINKLTKKEDKEKYRKLILEAKDNNTYIDIEDIELMLLASLGYEISCIRDNEDIPNIIRDALIRERAQYRNIVGYEVINCGADIIKYKKHNLDNKIVATQNILPGEKEFVTNHDLKMLMSEKKFSGKIANATLGFIPYELEIKDGVHFIDKCIIIKLSDTAVEKRQVYVKDIERRKES